MNLLQKAPWLERGQFSPYKTAVLALLCVPGLWVAYQLNYGMLGPRPLNAAIHEIGLWGIRILFLSLAITPWRQVWQAPRLMVVRRMIGVASFVYIVAHLVLYAADQAWDLWKVATEIVLRIYLTIGFVALLALLAMAVTSTDAMVKKLGGRNWRRLHQLAYPTALLAVVHHYMQSKVNVDEPLIMSGLLFWLLTYRVWVAKRDGQRLKLWMVAVLGVGSAALTALGEGVYYNLKLNAPILAVMQANLDLELDVASLRPAVWVFAITLAVTLIGLVRAKLAPKERKERLRVKTA
jgi:methionine sulfoxide reductase heme-binding subunit